MSSKPMPAQMAAQVALSEGIDKAIAAAQAPAPVAPAEPEPVVQPQPAEPAQAPVVVAPAPPGENWEHKFKTLQGMFGRVKDDAKAIRDENARLAAEVAKLAKPAQPAQPAAQFKAITDKDKLDFGEDLCAFVEKYTSAYVAHAFAGIESRLIAIENGVQASGQAAERATDLVVKTARDAYYEALDKAVPGWEAIQTTPEAQAWLGQKVPGTRSIWNDVLVGANEQLDFDGVVEVFNELFKVYPQIDPRKKPAAPRPAAPANPLENEIAPQRGAGSDGSPPGQPAKKMYKAKEYESESMRVVRMRQARQYEEADVLEVELNTALLEGRVVP